MPVPILKQRDCLIASVAIRNEAELLCRDADFEAIARYAPLKILVQAD